MRTWYIECWHSDDGSFWYQTEAPSIRIASDRLFGRLTQDQQASVTFLQFAGDGPDDAVAI